MIYLVSKFPCLIVGKESFDLHEWAKYCVDNVDNTALIVYPNNGDIPFSLNLVSVLNNEPHNRASVVEFGRDKYIFLNSCANLAPMFTRFKYSNMEICITLSRTLNITVNGECIFDYAVEGINYSHFEIVGAMLIIYFEGVRNYVVILKDKELKCADFYDEINLEKDEIYFLTRAYDSLNHGKVRSIKNKVFDEYIVYLDEEKINVREELTHLVFLDCLKVKNYNYCNSLLADGIKQEDAKQIKQFFPDFDEYYPIGERGVILLKKNALAGKFKFEIIAGKIENIISLN